MEGYREMDGEIAPGGGYLYQVHDAELARSISRWTMRSLPMLPFGPLTPKIWAGIPLCAPDCGAVAARVVMLE